MEDFIRESRYIVLKIKDIEELSPELQEQLRAVCVANNDSRKARGKPPFSSVVVESDWLCYEMAWHLIEFEASEYCQRKMEAKEKNAQLSKDQIESLRKVFNP